ncbi:MAG TPA: Ig-like domain-containing protein, partial [Acidimicrobiales bacterium]
MAAVPAAAPFDTGNPSGPYPGAYTAAQDPELFTSDGPIHHFFDASGNPITPGDFSSTGGSVTNGPALASADGVSTGAPGFRPFFGTSAAAPNAAAIAALAKSAVPTLTTAQIQTAMTSTAIDIGAPGVDTTTGAGIVMAPDVLAAAGATPGAHIEQGDRTFTEVSGDGDNSTEPGEVWDVTSSLTNDGGATATDVSTTLSSTDPNVAILDATATYPDLAVDATSGATGGHLRFRVARGCPCGTLLDLKLTTTSTGSNNPSVETPVVVPAGQAGTTADDAYAGPVVPIPDGIDATTAGPPATAPVVVSGGGTVDDLTFSIDGTSCDSVAGNPAVGFDHTFAGDLTATLTSPSGTVVTLFSETGAGGNNFCQTVLSDDATTSIQGQPASAAPFTGTFKPEEPLSAFQGEPADGTWTLTVTDGAVQDTGNIRAFSLHITPFACDNPNATPVAVADSYTTTPGTALSVDAPGVLANDTDADSDPLTAAKATDPDHGTLTLGADGKVDYTPTGGFHGVDTFTYTATDGAATSTPATVTITVDNAPVASPDTSTAVQDGGADLIDVVGNDTDSDSDALTPDIVTQP